MEILLGVLAILAGGGGIAGIITSINAAKKGDVETLRTVITTLQEDYARLDRENDELRAELKALRAQYADLEWKYDHVLAWAVKRGYVPPGAGPGG